MSNEQQDLTPMMRQYHAIKQENPEALLFFLLAVNERDDQLGCSFLDISTGEFRAAQFSGADRWTRLALDVEHLAPREVLFPVRMKERVAILDVVAKTSLDDWLFDADYASR